MDSVARNESVHGNGDEDGCKEFTGSNDTRKNKGESVRD